ncbi:hypothetical protein [Microbacterium sp.]|uniref:hypothetical protein n=1 Tax=Microbacterium sp. TaxID=51671 RepID=UPI003A865F13
MKGRRIQPDRDVPVVLPQVVAVVQHDGRLRLSVNGRTEAEPVGRTELGRALSRIAAEAGGPVRVEVRETNGASYADIIEPPSEAEDVGIEVEPAASFAVTYEGFLAGEEILIAVVDRVERADADGRLTLATGVRPHTRRERRAKRDVIVFGSTSGTTIIGAID